MAGFSLYSLLADQLSKFKETVGISSSDGLFFPVNVIIHWLNHHESLKKKPTWRALLDVLKELDLSELSQQIEMYLSSFSSGKFLGGG